MQSERNFPYLFPCTALILGLALFMAGVQARAQITFMSERDGNKEVYVLGADGRTLRNLTNHSADDWTPSWSPDGNRIAFMSNRDNNNEIYVMDIDDRNLTRLTHNAETDDDPNWSRAILSITPAGKQFVMWGEIKNGNYDPSTPEDESFSDPRSK